MYKKSIKSIKKTELTMESIILLPISYKMCNNFKHY